MSGAGGSFETQLPTMQTAAQHVYDVNEQIQQSLNGLQQRLEPLASAWQGEAAIAFQMLMNRWNEDTTKLNKALRGIGDGLLETHGLYQVAEDQVRQGITQITSRLGGR